MLLQIILLPIGLALLIGGAEMLVRGASALARTLGVPPLVIGLTVVSFGTSTPEVVVNTMSAYRGDTALAYGNIVGACAVNIGFVLALSAIIRPLAVKPSIITQDIPMMMLAVGALGVLTQDRVLGTGSPDVLSRSDGIMLLLLFVVFLYYTVYQALVRRGTDEFIHEVEEEAAAVPSQTGRSIVVLIIGLVAIALGGRITVDSAVRIAEALNVSQAVIGLTILSLGTTLPELATNLMAVRRGHTDIAIGNVVGSNIFNMLFIGGVAATITPVPVPMGGALDLLLVGAFSAILLPLAMTGQRVISRVEGGLLLAGYLAYMIWRSWTALTMDGAATG